MLAGKFTIDAPVLEPATGGLLDVANVITDAGGYELTYGVQYVPHLEGKNLPVPAEGVEKDFEKIEGLTESVPFATYRGVDVSFLRYYGDVEGLVEKAYTGSESYGIERAVQEQVLNPKAEVIALTTDNVRAIIGTLEQFAADNYSGLPLISGNRLAITLIEDALVAEGGKLFTKLGTPVAVAGGYGADGPGVAVAGANEAWLYISGQINIWKGEVSVVEGPALERNRDLGLAEGLYAASVDGPVRAILITI